MHSGYWVLRPSMLHGPHLQKLSVPLLRTHRGLNSLLPQQKARLEVASLLGKPELDTEYTDRMLGVFNIHYSQESNYKKYLTIPYIDSNEYVRKKHCTYHNVPLFKYVLKVIANFCMPENIFEMFHKTNTGLLYPHKTTLFFFSRNDFLKIDSAENSVKILKSYLLP